MHDTIRALIELHRVNEQRQRLKLEQKQRADRKEASSKAMAAANAAVEAAKAKVSENDALLRQYTQDVERCDSTIVDLRSKQMTAKTNKEYLDIINGIEAAKAEKKLREESLTNLNEQVEELKAAVEAAAAKAEQVEEASLDVQTDVQGDEAADVGADELEKIYKDKRQAVDAKFLEHYERLIAARHRMPLVPVDGTTRATPVGMLISHNQMEQLRMGHLVIDATSNGILYIKD